MNYPAVPYESDEVTRLINDRHDSSSFEPTSHLTVGDFCKWLLGDEPDSAVLSKVAAVITPEMAATVCKLMRNQDLIQVSQKCCVVTAFCGTIALPGRLSTRLQPDSLTDDAVGIAASVLVGLVCGVLYVSGEQ